MTAVVNPGRGGVFQQPLKGSIPTRAGGIVVLFSLVGWQCCSKSNSAPVISEHECRRQSVQFLPVSFGDSSGWRVDPELLQGFLCSFLRFRNFLEVCLTRLLEPLRVGVVQNPRAMHNHFFLLSLFLAHSVTISFYEANTPRRKAEVQHRLVRFDTPPGPFNSRIEGILHRVICQFSTWLESPYIHERGVVTSPRSLLAASLAKYVRMMSAPARLMEVSISVNARSGSSHPLRLAAASMANSPETL